MKTCSKCKETKPKTEFHNHSKMKDGKQAVCKTCWKDYAQTKRCKTSVKKYQYETWQGIANVIRGHMKSNSLRRGHEWVDTYWTAEKVKNCIENQSCAITGIPFELKNNTGHYSKRAFIPSPDRIDNSKGYEPDNVQWVVSIYNFMKNNFEDEDVARFLQTLKNIKDSNDF